MVVRKQSPPTLFLSTPSPDFSPRCSLGFSDCDADDEAMSTEEYIPPRPLNDSSHDLKPVGPYCPRIPTLQDILNGSASPPWTLPAFTAYLAQNHCLETLEFTIEAERYKQKYDKMAAQMAGMPMTSDLEECERVRKLWQRLIDTYIIPDGPREVNLPSDVRDTLLSLPNHTSPPPPEELDAAVKRIYDLMNESVLMNFISELSPSRAPSTLNEVWSDSDENMHMGESMDESYRRSRPRRKTSPPLSTIDLDSHLHNSLGNRLSHSYSLRNRLSAHTSNGSTGSGEAMLTDDSGSPTSATGVPMTPPTTPPSSDIGGSPRSRNENNTWKKMMSLSRLGTSKKKSASKMGRIEDEEDA